MKPAHSTGLQLLGILAFLVGGWALMSRLEGCESLTPPPAPRWPGVHALSATGLTAALVRGADDRLLLRDDASAAVVVPGTVMILLPPSERRPPAEAISAALAPLPPDVRAALWDRTALVVWLGRGEGHTAEATPRPSWEAQLRLDLVHDDLTDAGCLVRAVTSPDPAHPVSNQRHNKIAKQAAAAEELLIEALGHSAEAPFTDDEVATRRARGWRLLHTSGVWAERQVTVPLSAMILIAVLLIFFWRAAADGAETIAEVNLAALDRDGALIVPAKKGEGYRVLSHGLLHTGFQHLANNCISIWIGCFLLEPAIGSARTLLVFVAGVAAGGWARLHMKRPGHLVGASGGAFALEGAAFALVLLPGPWVPVVEQHGFMVMLAVMLGLGLLLSFMPNISLLGHLVGAAAGGLSALTGILTLGRPTLDGGAEPGWIAIVVWALAGAVMVAWIFAGVWVRHLAAVEGSTGSKK